MKEIAGNAELLQWSISASSSREVVVALEGELDLANADALGDALQEVLDGKPVKLTVDLASLSFLDSTGIRCLVRAAQAAANVGCRLVVRNQTGIAERVLQLCGVDEVLADGPSGDASEGR